MESDLLKYLLIGSAGLVFYAVLARGLFKATEPSRQLLLDLADKLTSSHQVSDAKKRAIIGRLSEVHSARSAWSMLFIVFYAAIVARTKDDDRLANGIPPHLAGDFQRFSAHWIIATLANSPIAALLAITIVILRAAATVSVGKFMAAIGRVHDKHSIVH